LPNLNTLKTYQSTKSMPKRYNDGTLDTNTDQKSLDDAQRTTNKFKHIRPEK